MTKSKGNVLIALTVVLICVFLTLVGVGLSVFIFVPDPARDELGGTRIAQQKAATLRQQISIYLMNNNLKTVPDDFEVSELTTGPNASLEPKDVVDPWGRGFIVDISGSGASEWSVISYGADGEPGGEGVNADIVD